MTYTKTCARCGTTVTVRDDGSRTYTYPPDLDMAECRLRRHDWPADIPADVIDKQMGEPA